MAEGRNMRSKLLLISETTVWVFFMTIAVVALVIGITEALRYR